MPLPGTADLLAIARSGFPQNATRPRKIVVVGAGMAGLVAAYELRHAGHEVTILEAQQRIGGRILTLREPFSDGLHTEAGAMRVPAKHKLTNTYLQKFDLPTTKFTMNGSNTFYYFGGQKYLQSEVQQKPGILGLDLAGPGGNSSILQTWEEFVRHSTEQLESDEKYWDELLGRHGDTSLFEFFRRQNYSIDSITAFAWMAGLEPVLRNSVLELLQVAIAWHDTGMLQIVGGMDGLPNAFLPHLQDSIQLGAEVVALDYTEDSVTVHYKREGALQQVQADFAVISLPYPVLRFVDVLKSFSPGKQMAMRHLNYLNAVKIFLECRRRFWEQDDGIYGGTSVTDLPIQQIVYPDHGQETGRGVLIGCYTYDREANRWGALPPEERLHQAVRYVARMHPQINEEFERGTSKVWAQDKFAGGAFALFEPGQQALWYPHIVAPEGPIHFAGEHTSLKHSWIEGAVESGLRAAQEVHECALNSP